MLATGAQYRACDVCRLVDHNCDKKICNYCSLCDAWICRADQNNWTRRLKAATKRKLEPGYAGLPNYEEKVKEHERTQSSN